MIKNIQRLTLLLLISGCIAISGCKKDTPNAQANIAGTWKLTNLSGNNTSSGTNQTNVGDIDVEAYTYNSSTSILTETCQNSTINYTPPATECNQWYLTELWTFTANGNNTIMETHGPASGQSLSSDTLISAYTLNTSGTALFAASLDSLAMNQIIIDNIAPGTDGNWAIQQLNNTTMVINLSGQYAAQFNSITTNYTLTFTKQ